jgi:hypothetical protein
MRTFEPIAPFQGLLRRSITLIPRALPWAVVLKPFGLVRIQGFGDIKIPWKPDR